MDLFLLILGMGLCTFLPRYLPLILWGDREFPDKFKTLLGFVPPAVLAAVVFPSLLMPTGGSIDLSWTNTYLVGGLVAIIAALISKRMLLSSFIGIVTFFVMQSLLGI